MEFDSSRYEAKPLLMSEILCDHTFNCRGRIAESECVDLAASINDKGLDFPIQVQPCDIQGYKYRIVSGHRRYTAFKLLKRTHIPAVVRLDLQDENEARAANLRENIQRADLNLIQEAEAVNWYITKGYNVSQIGMMVGKSAGWVDTRRKVLTLPEQVRVAAKDKIVTQSHINQLYEHRHNPLKVMEMLRIIKERNEAGQKAIVIKEDIQVAEFVKAKRPKPNEVEDFLEVVANNITNKIDEPEYFAHRFGAWVLGNISQAQLYISLRRECDRLGLKFNPPNDVRKILDGVTKV